MQDNLVTTLTDNFGRKINYLRLSVTDRCNLRCVYCMNEHMTFLPRNKVLSIDELIFSARAFVELGIKKIRITGGEPLVRKGIITLCNELGKMNSLQELVMTTNGLLLNQYAKPLKQAGVSRLNISIDSLNENTFKQLTRVGNLSEVLAGINAAQQEDFERIKLNVVVMKGVNHHQVVDMVEFAMREHLDISFIEEMPLGHISSHQRHDTQYDNTSVITAIQERHSLVPINEQDLLGGPSRYYRINSSPIKVGFISPISHNFCSQCNRIRLTVEGLLLLCLGNEHSIDLKKTLQEHPQNLPKLKEKIIAAMDIKPEQHHFDPENTQIVRFMSATGG